MSGLYFHIPFCRKACTYCDFHFSTSARGREALLDAMEKELVLRAGELGDAPVRSIYFGGGTPSLLEPARIAAFLQLAHDLLRVRRDAEVTLEANPDDVTAERLEQWKAMGITRLSLGTQSFRNARLQWMGRAHNADQALRSIALIAGAGFASWTIDLIYGLPGMTLTEWDEQLAIALGHGMPHLSAYALTVEPRTALAHQVRLGRVVPAGDEAAAAQFDHLMARMKAAGLLHYEISNFGRPGHFGLHNSSYWEGAPYLGIGPAAHSFSGNTRRWNVASNARYTTAVEKGEPFSGSETLTAAQRTNEMLLTGLRTHRGVQLDALPVDIRPDNEQRIVHYVSQGLAQLDGGRLVLTERGRHFADRIAMELFAEP